MDKCLTECLNGAGVSVATSGPGTMSLTHGITESWAREGSLQITLPIAANIKDSITHSCLLQSSLFHWVQTLFPVRQMEQIMSSSWVRKLRLRESTQLPNNHLDPIPRAELSPVPSHSYNLNQEQTRSSQSPYIGHTMSPPEMPSAVWISLVFEVPALTQEVSPCLHSLQGLQLLSLPCGSPSWRPTWWMSFAQPSPTITQKN